MKKLYFLVLFVLCYTSALAQKSLQVEYMHYNDTDIPGTYKATLYTSSKASIYRERVSDIKHWEGKVNPHPDAVFRKLDTILDTYYKTIPDKKEVLFYDRAMKYNFYISDSFEIKWSIQDSVKQILGHKCIKAVTDFRGRTWEAWFAPDIALPYGPWKLRGLPGLILEAHDTTNRFSVVATAIQYKNTDMFKRDFSKLNTAYNKAPVTLKDFLDKSKEMMENSFKERSVENPDISITMIPVPRGEREIKYEWEE